MAMIDLNPGLAPLPVQGHAWARYRPRTWAGRLLEDLRVGGQDPLYRKALFASVLVHFTIIIVIPWLLTLGQGVENYRLPKGSGVPNPKGISAAAQQVPVRIKKVVKKPKRKFVLRANSSIRFDMPDLDDSVQLKEVEKATELEYKSEGVDAHEMVRMATEAAAGGKGAPGETGGGLVKGGTGNQYGRLGRGGGTQGGYPEGSENSKIRFVRLNHGGRDWNDNMNPRDRSDLNFLQEFFKYSNFKVETQKFEGYSMGQIHAMDKGYKPPFLYMTGTATINLSPSEMKMAREYVAEGGMFFGDCGSPEFNSHFRAFANALLPGSSLVEIADDDPIFQQPFTLPNGAPPLWHHGGERCMGVKHKGRWIVFYHPGDLKDAFRSPDHSGLDASTYQSAVRVGINVIAYAFDHYLEASRQYRK